MKILYTAEATAWGGREGRTASSDGVLDLALAMPKELGGPGGPATNPEQLFAAGYASCFHSALKYVASTDKVDVTDSAVTARVGIGFHDAGWFGLQVEIDAELPDVDPEVARGLLDKAHGVCPYSRATQGNIEVKVNLI